MKKAVSVFLAVLMLAAVFFGCAEQSKPVVQEPAVKEPALQESSKPEASEPESPVQTLIEHMPAEKKPLRHGPLRVLVDLDPKGLGANEATFDDLKWWVTAAAGIEEEDCVFEWIPTKGAARDTAIDRLRTEIMSGEGPDVFIMQSDLVYSDNALFRMPEKAMELGFFLPLDEYIESAEYAEWDNFTEIVMEAGRNEEGQQLVPLTYMLPAAMYRKSDVRHTPSQQMTWEEMQNAEELQDAVVRLGAGYTSFGYEDDPIEFILGDLADYESETLLFTDEELYIHVTEILEYTEEYLENKYAEKRYCTKTHLGAGFNNDGGEGTYSNNGGILNGLTENDPLTLVPLYSDDGGSTAVITSFAAVNRNTRYPEEAFKVIDLLMTTSRQANSDLFHQFIYPKMDYKGMPLHEDLMSSQYTMRENYTQDHWSLTDENFEAVCAVRDTISNVHFTGALDIVLESMMRDCFKAYKNGEDYTQIVLDAYSTMKKMMGE